MNHTSCGGIGPLVGVNETAAVIECISCCIIVFSFINDDTSPALAKYPTAPPTIKATRTAAIRTVLLFVFVDILNRWDWRSESIYEYARLTP